MRSLPYSTNLHSVEGVQNSNQRGRCQRFGSPTSSCKKRAATLTAGLIRPVVRAACLCGLSRAGCRRIILHQERTSPRQGQRPKIRPACSSTTHIHTSWMPRYRCRHRQAKRRPAKPASTFASKPAKIHQSIAAPAPATAATHHGTTPRPQNTANLAQGRKADRAERRAIMQAGPVVSKAFLVIAQHLGECDSSATRSD